MSLRRRAAAAAALLLLTTGPACSQTPPGPAAGAAPMGKRVAPPRVAPVVVDGLRIAVVDLPRERGFNQGGGVIEAFDAKTGASLWLLKVYDVAYVPALEWDVQDVFIARMKRAGRNRVRVDDERGRRWIVDVATRRVEPG